jgi:RNA polymerase sigma-70 factor, ECF subfamily
MGDWIDNVPINRDPGLARASPHRDLSLIAAIGDGSTASFELLYERYVQRAYRVAYSVCHDEGRAQDAVQEAFPAIWQASASFSAQRGTVSTWLLSIVRHRAIDVARGNGRHAARRAEQRSLPTIGADEQACDAVLRHEAQQQLRSSLAGLPRAQREAIALAYFAQLSHTEIACTLGLAPGTVKGRLRLGLVKLRQTVERP